MTTIKKNAKKAAPVKKVGKEATEQTELQQSVAPRIDKKVEKKAQKVADAKKKAKTPGIPNQKHTKQAGSEADVKPDDATPPKKRSVRKH